MSFVPSSRARAMAAGFSAFASAVLLAGSANASSQYSFDMVRSNGLPAGCASRAWAKVDVKSLGFAELMRVTVGGLPAGTTVVLFAIQQPNFPFGLGWYVADLTIGGNGSVTKTVIGRFNIESFALGSGEAAAPVTHPGDDADKNPAFKPVHTYHLGMWFDSVDDARRAGHDCPTFVTPFNGDHTAGVQVLSTRNFKKLGPLSKID
jgi:hypothetical protein